jgi:hypothetical protein
VHMVMREECFYATLNGLRYYCEEKKIEVLVQVRGFELT